MKQRALDFINIIICIVMVVYAVVLGYSLFEFALLVLHRDPGIISRGTIYNISIPINIPTYDESSSAERKIVPIYISRSPIGEPPTDEQLLEERELGDMELLSQLVQAEAGNQDLTGKRLVADVVLNRLDDPRFPNTIRDVIFQINPVQFSVTVDGAFEKAAWNMAEDDYLAVELEWKNRMDYGVLYFSSTTDPANGRNAFKHGDHWFSY